MQSLNFCRIFSLFGVTIHASKDRNGSSWVREPPNLLLSVFGRTGPAEKVPRAGGLQDRTEGSCNPNMHFYVMIRGVISSRAGGAAAPLTLAIGQIF